MALRSGEKLGPYEIVDAAGAGGMGEVYRARDTRLERTVAIKILPAHLAGDSAMRQRLDREAKAIATLSHPHICTLYDVGHQSGVDFLVMEYLEGETLDRRLSKGPLPLDELLKVAVQVADALERSHKQGIVHRDLKPANIMLTKGGAKLMDFGLAKGNENAPLATALTEMTADAKKLTAEGTIVGTFQYMSPEQLEGHEADVRTDIFAFGEVVYEMATGRPAFSGRTKASLIASILSADPKPLSEVAPMTPPALERVVRTCLAKDPDERFQTAHDLKLQLQWIAEGGTQLGIPAPLVHRRRNRERLAWASGVVLALLVAASFLFYQRTRPRELYQFLVMPPEKVAFNFRGLSGPPVVSPEGKRVAFVATVVGRVGDRSLWLRSLDSVESRPLSGTDGATYPFWSPDSRFIGFFANGKMKKIEVATGVVLNICDVAEGRGGAWNEQGVILFGQRDLALLRTTAAGGAEAQKLTALDRKVSQTSHRFPYFMPDGEHFIYVAQGPETHAFFTSLSHPENATRLNEVTGNVAFVDGRLLYTRESTLLAQPFDPVKGTFSGDPVPIGEQVQSDPQFNFSVFSSSQNGVLAFQSGAVDVGTKLIVLDRKGGETLLDTEPSMIGALALAPSGRLAMSVREPGGTHTNIWQFSLADKQKSRFTFDDQSCCPYFSPDGSKLLYASSAASAGGSRATTIRLKPASGLGSEEVLLETPDEVYPSGWSPDGKYVLLEKHAVTPQVKWELWAVPATGGGKPFLLLKSDTDARDGHVSPDGKWLTFDGRDSGRFEIYVIPFRPDPSDATPKGKWQVSNGGALQPTWSNNGKELFFSNSSYTTLLSADINAQGDTFSASAPKPLFDLNPHPVFNQFYFPAADGQHFYMTVYSQGSAEPFIVTVNWMEKLKH
ncbi:MAG: serine/threonine-protein kinase [Candidatus Koribacter versatilis]|uniref:non-specific serine/threonine protein kinase n=1 Tax=Candidatus Korobacter versatilis TaxID=658062 RepID=A0A932ERA4_9BACT|nr:serine/threonine-protein kinase [Candidatus Koribacter versatilis]